MNITEVASPLHYSIRELTRLTGLSADVLRVWERRYGFPQPQRDAAGARRYHAADVERLGLLQRALQRGHRVSQVIGCTCDELRNLLEQKRIDFDSLANEHAAVRRILEALCLDDDERVVSELRYAAMNLGARDFVREVASVLVRVVGESWQQGRLQVRHEHFLSDALTTQLRVIWASQFGILRGERVLLATLPGEWHSLGIEMVGTYLAAMGVVPRSLGPNTPPDEIAAAARALRVDGVALSVSAGSDPTLARLHLAALVEQLDGYCPVLIGGALADQLRLPSGAHYLRDWDALEEWVRQHRRAALGVPPQEQVA